MTEPIYSDRAWAQLDKLDDDKTATLYDAVLDAIDLITDSTSEAMARSDTFRTDDGLLRRLPIVGHYSWCVFWSPDGPSIEAIAPSPRVSR